MGCIFYWLKRKRGDRGGFPFLHHIILPMTLGIWLDFLGKEIRWVYKERREIAVH